MILSVDIGNTHVTFGFLERHARSGAGSSPNPGGDWEVHSFKISTEAFSKKSSAVKILAQNFYSHREYLRQTEGCCVCSVVPARTKIVCDALVSMGVSRCVTIGRDLAVPIINRYRIPQQVGQDRLVGAYAGWKLYGPGLIVVDFGTAITFDVVSRKGEYLGGLIAPGLKIVREALHERTALLPHVTLSRPIELIGKDTVSSMRAGIIFGSAGCCDGILSRLLKKECRGYRVVLTGGDAAFVLPYLAKNSVECDEFLILKGLFLLFESQKTRRS